MTRRARLSDQEVLTMRIEWVTRVTRKQLAARYGCSLSLVKHILDNPSYRPLNQAPPEPKVSEDEFLELVGADADDGAT